MSDIFICYSRKDKTIAVKLKQRLHAEGWSVFMDEHIDAGHRWAEEIETQLAEARAVLTLWSQNSVKSRFVMDEAHEAADRNIIFPVRIDSVAIPYGFRQFQTPDLIDWDGITEIKPWLLLLNSLRKHLMVGQSDVIQEKIERNQFSGQQSPGLLASRHTFRDQLRSGGEGPLMVVIPAGRFMMGSPENESGRNEAENPQHEVIIAKPFALGVYAVTFAEYDRFCEEYEQKKPDDEDWGRVNRPVINVSWHDAQAYCAWLSKQTGKIYRLPSEAQWEYACRAGTKTPFYTGQTINSEQANFIMSQGKTLPVGSFPPNEFGLYDMHGNVWEWCQDRWHGDYLGAPDDGAAWEDGNSSARVVRGGSWDYGPGGARSSARYLIHPGLRNDFIGFRVLCESPIE